MAYFYYPLKKAVRMLTAGNITKHFKWAEFDSKDGVSVPEDLKPNVQKLAEQLEIIRAELGNNPIVINSGYRTFMHNFNVGGAIKSLHLEAKAADIRVKNVLPKKVFDTIKRLMNEGKIAKGGVGLYKNFVHYDIRGHITTWEDLG